ncbi:alpha-L-fucosidase [Zunongwangia sp.]|uniref:alpha-L-fucosidase n=1 Tax=Zunongwangia sp. TaxID=1965325 RepID=UPI003AA99F0B
MFISKLKFFTLSILTIPALLLGCKNYTAISEEHLAEEMVYELPPIPDTHTLPENSVSLGSSDTFGQVAIDIPITAGPYKPTWASIEQNYPGTPDWLREAKLGLWVHFGPQSSGNSGDWYARRLYTPGTRAYKNHLENFGHPSKIGYKEVLREWNPEQLNPEKLVNIYKNAGFQFLIIQGVHHDQFDLWDSKYQPWNAKNLGPKRDLLKEWANAARKTNIRFGITFHHEYSWWWWQTAFQADEEGPLAGVPYDGNLSLEDGKGTWWEGYDPRLLYGVNLREYQGVGTAANSAWSPPPAGIFKNHLKFANWYSKWWAARMMDAVDKYQPDFIYTDGTDQQPFSGHGTGTGYKSNAMQNVIADYYNKTLKRRGKVDVFSIVKFRKKTNGTVNTEEGSIPKHVKTDQAWIAETPVGDWFYAPGFTYSSEAVIRYLLEEVARDGNVGICVSLLPDGSLDNGSKQMLKEMGEWMKINGEGIYGSYAWEIIGEGENDKLNVLPGGKIGARQANHKFSTADIRFTKGKDGKLYVWVMTVPKVGEILKIKSLGLKDSFLSNKIKKVRLLGYNNKLDWKQEDQDLIINCPAEMPFNIAVGFQIETE